LLQLFKILGIIIIVILSMCGIVIGGIVGMFVGGAAIPLKILTGRASKSGGTITDILNGDTDQI
jgi:hypothetical protein